VWSPVEDVTLRLGGPRTGKSGELACRILDAPGAVLATSTRTDLVSLTGGLRARRGPVHVFNPSGLGQLASTVKFSPLIGCRDPRVAADRAADLVGATSGSQGNGDREWWAGQARDVLTVLMHAAALVDQSMNTVAGWIADTASAQSPVLRALDRSPQPEVFREVARGFLRHQRPHPNLDHRQHPPSVGVADRRHRRRLRGRHRRGDAQHRAVPDRRGHPLPARG
jgi:hypothetical protein